MPCARRQSMTENKVAPRNQPAAQHPGTDAGTVHAPPPSLVERADYPAGDHKTVAPDNLCGISRLLPRRSKGHDRRSYRTTPPSLSSAVGGLSSPRSGVSGQARTADALSDACFIDTCIRSLRLSRAGFPAYCLVHVPAVDAAP